MSEQNTKPGMNSYHQDPLLDTYQAAAGDDSFRPAPRVRGAVLMYARTLADHRSAFPGSMAHQNEDEELELSSVPRDKATLDPRALPVKPLAEEEQDNWPRELPPAPVQSAWLSLSKWVLSALAGGLALGAAYSWFNASRMSSQAPEPMIAQASSAAPAAVPPPVSDSGKERAIAKADDNATNTAPNATPSVDSAANQDKPAQLAARAAKPLGEVPPTPRELSPAAAAPAAAAKPQAAPAAVADASATRGKLSSGSTVNPPVAAANGNAIAPPQIAARSLPVAKTAADAAVAAAPAAPPAAATSPTRAALEADPTKWMAYVNELIGKGRIDEANTEIAKLYKRYPQLNPNKPAAGASAAQ